MDDRMCKITDFGTSRAMDNLFAMTMTKGQGTPLYMAPEVLSGTEHYSAAVDVYSYGILVWSVANDRAMPYLEYNFKNALMMQNAIVDGTRPMIKDGTRQEFVGLMSVCWAKEPSGRSLFSEVIRIVESIS